MAERGGMETFIQETHRQLNEHPLRHIAKIVVLSLRERHLRLPIHLHRPGPLPLLLLLLLLLLLSRPESHPFQALNH